MTTPRRRRDREQPKPITDVPFVVRAGTEPTYEEIARHAYALYQARGRDHGQDATDWFRAEREIAASKKLVQMVQTAIP